MRQLFFALIATGLLAVAAPTQSSAGDGEVEKDVKIYEVCVECQKLGGTSIVLGTGRSKFLAETNARVCCALKGGVAGSVVPCPREGDPPAETCMIIPTRKVCQPCRPRCKLFSGRRSRCFPRRGLLRRGCRPVIVRRQVCR